VEFVHIQFTIDDPERADAIAAALLEDHLVACAQRSGPVVSRYWWEGSVERAEEWLVVLKTNAGLSDRVVDAIIDRHPYETPEVVVTAITGGAPGYLAWIGEMTAGPGG
jgi:periplasmic divalent cation tolerance protein